MKYFAGVFPLVFFFFVGVEVPLDCHVFSSMKFYVGKECAFYGKFFKVYLQRLSVHLYSVRKSQRILYFNVKF